MLDSPTNEIESLAHRIGAPPDTAEKMRHIWNAISVQRDQLARILANCESRAAIDLDILTLPSFDNLADEGLPAIPCTPEYLDDETHRHPACFDGQTEYRYRASLLQVHNERRDRILKVLSHLISGAANLQFVDGGLKDPVKTWAKYIQRSHISGKTYAPSCPDISRMRFVAPTLQILQNAFTELAKSQSLLGLNCCKIVNRYANAQTNDPYRSIALYFYDPNESDKTRQVITEVQFVTTTVNGIGGIQHAMYKLPGLGAEPDRAMMADLLRAASILDFENFFANVA